MARVFFVELRTTTKFGLGQALRVKGQMRRRRVDGFEKNTVALNPSNATDLVQKHHQVLRAPDLAQDQFLDI